MKFGAYLRLMRFHKPVGIMLLWFPTAWGLWVANNGAPSILLLTYFALGTIIMRSVGCVINDLADRRIDKHVQRTFARPITTGEIGVREALWLVFVLLLIALLIVLQLPLLCFYYALAALVVTIVYPFCKRFFQAPQLVLGIAFSMGIPMAYVASGAEYNLSMLVLCLLNFAWIVSYDTMYAMVDRPDDLRIGVKSTAILFAQYDKLIIMMLQVFFHLNWLLLGYLLHGSWSFYGFWIAGSLILLYQQYLMHQKKEKGYFSAFSSNIWYGFLMWLALLSIQTSVT